MRITMNESEKDSVLFTLKSEKIVTIDTRRLSMSKQNAHPRDLSDE